MALLPSFPEIPSACPVRLVLAMLLVGLVPVGTGCRKSTSPPSQPPAASIPVSNISGDEEILFFPTYAWLDQEENVWRSHLNGTVFEPETDSIKRAVLVTAIRGAASLGKHTDDGQIREDRIRPFLIDHERGKSVAIEIAGNRFSAGTSGANGRFTEPVVLNADWFSMDEASTPVQVIFEAILPAADSRSFTGRVHLVQPQGVSVISDIDDTIKHSQVTDRSELMKNTFLRDFQAVEEMPELYRELAQFNAMFHYVSGSPWQLYQPLEEFTFEAGFPEGTFHLKQFRLTDSSAADMLSSQEETKLAAIVPLLRAFPQRKFFLIGDSGEQDPEIYSQLAREHPEQVIGVYLRNVTGEKADGSRFQSAMAGVPPQRWALFEDVAEVRQKIVEAAQSHAASP